MRINHDFIRFPEIAGEFDILEDEQGAAIPRQFWLIENLMEITSGNEPNNINLTYSIFNKRLYYYI